MKLKILVFSVVFAVLAVFTLSSTAFAFAHTGQITKIAMWESGSIYIEVTNSGSTAYYKPIYPALSDSQINQILAMALTAQSSGQEVTIFIVSGTIRSITAP